MTTTLSPEQARATWIRHQGLDQPAGGQLGEVVARTGWVRTLGGVDGYLSLAARSPGLTAAAVHEAVGAGALRMTPSLRGCIYVVPDAHAPLALALARDLSATRDARDAARAGIEEGELQTLGEGVLTVLHEGPRSTHELRAELPDGAIRSLGDQGKKVGISSTLPPALRQLEFAGLIRREPLEGRIDHERYTWVLAGEGTVDPRPAPERDAALVELLLGWMAPASVGEVAELTGLSKGRVKEAMARVGAVEVGGREEADAMLPRQLARVDEPLSAPVHLLPGTDGLLVWHGGPSPFVRPEDLERSVSAWGGRRAGTTWATARQPLTRVVLVEGRIAGQWDLDPDAGEVVVGAYGRDLPEEVGQVVQAVEALLGELGHGKAFSIEKDEHLRKRAAAVRQL